MCVCVCVHLILLASVCVYVRTSHAHTHTHIQMHAHTRRFVYLLQLIVLNPVNGIGVKVRHPALLCVSDDQQSDFLFVKSGSALVSAHKAKWQESIYTEKHHMQWLDLEKEESNQHKKRNNDKIKS